MAELWGSLQESRLELKLDLSKKLILFLGNKNEMRKNFQLLKNAYDLLDPKDVHLLHPYPISSNKVHLYLNACDVLVLPSLLEGSPNVIKEAMVCNCPIVSTDVGDVKERIENINGCYLSTFDKYDLAKKIKIALQFNNRTNGRSLSTHLKVEEIARNIISIYRLIE